MSERAWKSLAIGLTWWNPLSIRLQAVGKLVAANFLKIRPGCCGDREHWLRAPLGIWRQQLSGRFDHAARLWTVLMWQAWLGEWG